MLSQNLRGAAKNVLNNLKGQRGYSSFDRDIFSLANAMTKDFKRSMRRISSPWDFGHGSSVFYEPSVYYRPTHSTYEQKTITSDNSGRVVVKTQRKVPGRGWETYVEEYVNDKTLEQDKKSDLLGQNQEANAANQTAKNEPSSQQETVEQSNSQSDKATESTSSTPQNAKDQRADSEQLSAPQKSPRAGNMSSLLDQHFRDFDHFFDMSNPFTSSRWFEPEIDMFEVDNNATYHSKTVVNNNGHVTVKTITKQPGSAWETSVKEYNQDGAVEGSKKKTESIDDSSKTEQKVTEEAENKVENHQQSSVDQTASQ